MKLILQSIVVVMTITSTNFVIANNQSISGNLIQQGQGVIDEIKFQQREKKLLELVDSSPSKNTYIQLANLYLSQNKNTEAISNYKKAILHDPKDPKLFTSMSIAYLHLGLYEMSKAMAEHAISLDPTISQADNIVKYINKKLEVLAKASEADKRALAAHE